MHKVFTTEWRHVATDILIQAKDPGKAASFYAQEFGFEVTDETSNLPPNPGDHYLLYTDGLPESKNGLDQEFGLARCKQSLNSYPDLTAAALADELLGKISHCSAFFRSLAGTCHDSHRC